LLEYPESIPATHEVENTPMPKTLNPKYARLPFALALIFAFTITGVTQPVSKNKDRIRGAVDASQTTVVRSTAHPMARPQFDQGRADITSQLSGVSLVFRLSPSQQADMNQLLRDQQDRKSPLYHKWITPEQYAARFGMTQNDLAKVASWAQSQGLTVNGISRNRNEISFSGSVGQVEYALKTELHKYSINAEQHFANATDVALPAAFSAQVLSVRGLDDFRPKPRIRKPAPRFTSSVSGNHFLIPGDFATIYDLPGAFDGTGQSIAVVGQTAINNSDIDAFRSAAGLSVNDPNVVLVPGTGVLTHSPGDETEADLDLEWSNGVAPKATIQYVTVGNNSNFNVFDSLHYAITANVAPVISISYGNCEANLGTSFVLTMQQWAQQANAQGQTISGPGADNGAADCEPSGSNVATTGLAVDIPAAIPEVTGVGGSEFTLDSTQCPGTPPSCPGGVSPADPPYWSGSSSPTSGASALKYIPEMAWNDTAASLAAGGGLAGTGGGASTIFGKPSWQTGAGVPADGKRDVPDIALSASNFHDSYLICSQDYFAGSNPPVTSCTTGFRASDNTLSAIGGTSAGAPSFAGVLALLNQATASNGLGNVNPMLYQLAAANSSNHAFHDITTGDNKVPCTAGTKDCPAGTVSIGFTAGPGYDQVTGLGSLDVGNLVTAWIAATPAAADFSMDGLVSTISAPGASGSSTITVTAQGGFTGTVNLTCVPTSTTVHITCSLLPTSVSLTNGAKTQTAVLSIGTLARLDYPTGPPPRGMWLAGAGSTLFAAIVLCGVPSRRRRNLIFGLLLVASITTIVSCGGSSGGGGGGGGGGTPAGTYTVTVTGTGPSTSHSTTVSVTVQ
jgi:subtilase family serine protease